MDDATLYSRMWDGMWQFFRLMGGASDGARLIEQGGVIAAVAAATPERSLFNSVGYRDPSALESAYDELAEAYDEAGVRAWTVWARESDRDLAKFLEERGHKLDADPAAMAAELHEMDLGEDDGGDYAGTLAEMALINGVCYSHVDDFRNGLANLAEDAFHVYVARRNGEAVATAGTLEVGGDATIVFVGTLPEARGAGLSKKLMRHALRRSRERGCTTTSLQATKMGEPIYTSIGYRSLGPLEMWEKRKP